MSLENFENFSRKELREKCKEMGIMNSNKMTPEEMRELLTDKQNEEHEEHEEPQTLKAFQVELPIVGARRPMAGQRERQKAIFMFLGLEPVVPIEGFVATVQVVDGKKVEASKKASTQTVKHTPEVKIHRPISTGRVSTKGITIQKDRQVRNGVRRPSEGTVCADVWAQFDRNPQLTSKDLPELADKHGWNRNNVSCEFYVWRKFNGIKGNAKSAK